MKYESNILKRLIDTYGVVGNPRYISEIIKEFIVRGKELYPHLFTYQADWLAHIDEFGLNPSYTVSYTGQSIYAPNTLERPVKRAILTGCTLVNSINYSTVSDLNGCTIIKNNDVITVTSQKSTTWLRGYYNLNITYDKKYIMMWDSLEYTHTSSSGINNLIGIWGVADNNAQYEVKAIKQGQTDNYLIFSIPNASPINLSKVTVRIHATTDVAEVGATTTIKGLKIMEYQEGMENWDIPYFEGMQSVKVPVLTTTGKNLINMNDYALTNGVTVTQQNENSITFNAPYTWGGLQYHMQLNPNTKYTVSMDRGENTIVQLYVRLKNENGNYSGAFGGGNKYSFTTNNTGFVLITIETNLPNQTNLHISNLQLEEGSTATPYEPYKSNILTVNEEVELRGIGDVRDTLDCLTGGLVQRIGEIKYDGSSDEQWLLSQYSTDDYVCAVIPISDSISQDGNQYTTSHQVKSDKFSFDGNVGKASVSNEGINNIFSTIRISVSSSKLRENTVNALKAYLQQNPITVQYQLKTESVKTVDLTILDQNGQNVKQLMSFNGGTHFNTGSLEGSLPPSVSVCVETDLEETLKVCSLEGNTM